MYRRDIVQFILLFRVQMDLSRYCCHAYHHHHHYPAMLANGPWDGANQQPRPRPQPRPRRRITALPHHHVIPHPHRHRPGVWRLRTRQCVSFRTDSSSSSMMMMTMSATTSVEHVTKQDDCRCCGDDNDDEGRPNDDICHNNEWVIRHVHQSTIDPAIWQQYMVPPPPVSPSWWWHGRFTNDHRPTTVDISFRWNSTTTATATTATIPLQNDMTATAERFWELYEAKRALVGQQPSRHEPAAWLESLYFFANNIHSPNKVATSHNPYREAMIQNLASAMTEFCTFCDQHLTTTHGRSFEMRLLCTYGSDAAKCPIWHVDHVPCRYVQTLYGPTVLFLNDHDDNQRVYHRIMAQHDEPQQQQEEEFVSVHERNAFLLRDMSRSVGHAHVGEGMILLGQSSSSSSSSSSSLWSPRNTTGAAVHKSPLISAPEQGRILLTMNVHDATKT